MSRPLQSIFGEVIRSYRKERRISQERLALDSDLQRSFISRLERGLTQPTLVTIFELAQALDVEPLQIIADVQNRWNNKHQQKTTPKASSRSLKVLKK
jgi:transcriptional regulator with XRE-family HTH domain